MRSEWSDVRLGAELGFLAALTARHSRFASSAFYGPLLSTGGEGWLTLGDAPASIRPKLLAIDVEMCERVADGAQLPVSAAVIAVRPGEERVVFEGLVDPGLEAHDEVRWKTEIHGVTGEMLATRRQAGRLPTVRDIQALLAAEWDDLTFLAGHGLNNDLKVLKVRGPPLRRRIIDTSLVHWCQGAPSLATLAGETNHDALADARAVGRVLLADLEALLGSLTAAPPARAANDRLRGIPGGDSRRPQTHVVSIFVPERLLGRVIGKKGSTLEAIRTASTDCDVDIASKGAEASSKRRFTVRGDSTLALKSCLDVLACHVPELRRDCLNALELTTTTGPKDP